MYIYFIRESGRGLVKIGSAKEPQVRLAALAAQTPHELELIGVVRGTRQHEIRIHEHFSDHRVWGEWFKPCPELVRFLKTLPPWTPATPQESVPIFSGAKRNIFFDLYRAGYKQAEIADHFGFSRQRANQLISNDHRRHPRNSLDRTRPPRPKPEIPIADYVAEIGGYLFHPLAIES